MSEIWNPDWPEIENCAAGIESRLNGESWKDKRNEFAAGREAKRHLIAAAPDLLEALDGLAAWVRKLGHENKIVGLSGDNVELSDPMERSVSAIAKANGE